LVVGNSKFERGGPKKGFGDGSSARRSPKGSTSRANWGEALGVRRRPEGEKNQGRFG